MEVVLMVLLSLDRRSLFVSLNGCLDNIIDAPDHRSRVIEHIGRYERIIVNLLDDFGTEFGVRCAEARNALDDWMLGVQLHLVLRRKITLRKNLLHQLVLAAAENVGKDDGVARDAFSELR